MLAAFVTSVALAVGAGDSPTLLVATLGDSITRGVREGVTPPQTFSSLLEARLRGTDLDVRVANHGVGGETTAGALARLDQVLDARPAIVLVMYGTNDCYVDQGRTESRVTIDEFRANLAQIVARIRGRGAQPLLMTEPCYAGKSPPNGVGEHGNVRLAPYMQACRDVARRFDVQLVDNFSLWTEALQRGDLLEDWTTDGYHPNPRGHQQLAEAIEPRLAAAVRDALAGPVDFDVVVDELMSHDDGRFTWYHPRAVVYPSGDARRPQPQALMTLQQHLQADDHYSGLYGMRQEAAGKWSPPAAIASLAWRTDGTGATVAVCDPTPGYHPHTQRVLVIGAQILYDQAGRQLTDRRHCHQAAYALYTPGSDGGTWSNWKTIALPDEDSFFLATPGCAQWVVEPDGDILLPVYHKGPRGQAYSATVFRCGFDGDTLTVRRRGATLELAEVRGLCEPSLVRWQGRYFLTLRNDLRGYVTASDDGLVFGPIKPWTFDDGTELGSYNTQQHWLAHSDGLFLVYTRRGANNDHVFRHRSPLFMARVDPLSLHVVRATERVVIADRGGEMGNFGANPVSPDESWVTVGEFVHNDEARRRGAKGSVLVARVRWSKPNRLRGGSGPGDFADAAPARPAR